jgi:hypothetical protein
MIKTVPSGAFASTYRKTDNPEEKEDNCDGPEEMDREAKTSKEKHEKKC